MRSTWDADDSLSSRAARHGSPLLFVACVVVHGRAHLAESFDCSEILSLNLGELHAHARGRVVAARLPNPSNRALRPDRMPVGQHERHGHPRPDGLGLVRGHKQPARAQIQGKPGVELGLAHHADVDFQNRPACQPAIPTPRIRWPLRLRIEVSAARCARRWRHRARRRLTRRGRRLGTFGDAP